jgi:hypothetical protein
MSVCNEMRMGIVLQRLLDTPAAPHVVTCRIQGICWVGCDVAKYTLEQREGQEVGDCSQDEGESDLHIGYFCEPLETLSACAARAQEQGLGQAHRDPLLSASFKTNDARIMTNGAHNSHIGINFRVAR